jgi:hypothetical protein
MDLTVIWFLLSIIVGMLGKNTYIGFWGNFILSLFFSPLVGIVYVLLAKRETGKKHAAYKH